MAESPKTSLEAKDWVPASAGMSGVERQLAAFLSRATRTAFAYGQRDCLLFLADWALELTGEDPAKGLRGRYADLLGAERILRVSGGMLELVAQQVEPLGWTPAILAQAGDIAVALAETERGAGLAGCICTGARFAFLTPDGVLSAAMAPLASWRAPCRR